MKKLISVLLAILMLFSIVTVAFAAEDATPDAPAVSEENKDENKDENSNPLKDMNTEDIMSYLENMSWTEIKFALKIAKIAVKLILVLDKLGFVDVVEPIKNALLDMIWDMIEDSVNGDAEQAPEVEESKTAPETTIAA